jgi:hypothetical protein
MNTEWRAMRAVGIPITNHKKSSLIQKIMMQPAAVWPRPLLRSLT